MRVSTATEIGVNLWARKYRSAFREAKKNCVPEMKHKPVLLGPLDVSIDLYHDCNQNRIICTVPFCRCRNNVVRVVSLWCVCALWAGISTSCGWRNVCARRADTRGMDREPHCIRQSNERVLYYISYDSFIYRRIESTNDVDGRWK